MIHIAGVTSSGIQFFTWTQRFLRGLGQDGFKDWAFQRPAGSRVKASDYQDNIFWKLEINQATTTLIDSGWSIWDEYSVQCSGRCFITNRCLNMKVGKHNIELQCCWSTDRANEMRTVQQSIIHKYSEVRNMKQALIRLSKACWSGPLPKVTVWPGEASRGILEWIWLRKMGWKYPSFLLRRCPSTFLGGHCLESSLWLILFRLMSIHLTWLGLTKWCLLEDACCLQN